MLRRERTILARSGLETIITKLNMSGPNENQNRYTSESVFELILQNRTLR